MDCCVVIPVYNERPCVEAVCQEWLPVFEKSIGAGKFTMLWIDDGSTDGTDDLLQKLEKSYAPAIQHHRKPNSGHGRSCRTGYEMALKQNAQWVFQIDSDGQCDPAYFPELWQKRLNADAVMGRRYRRDDGFERVVVSTFCRWLVRLFYGCDLRDANVPYRLIRADCLAAALKLVPDDIDIHNVALNLALHRTTDRIDLIPIRFRERLAGRGHLNFMKLAGKGIHLLYDLRRVGFPRDAKP